MRIEGYLDGIEFFADAHDPTTTYAEVDIPAIGASTKPYKMFVEMSDKRLQSYIRQFVMPNVSEKTSPTELLQEVSDILTLGGNPDTVAPRVRTAGKLHKGLIEYDLNNPAHEYVRVTPKGWKITDTSKHKFLKRNTLGAQVYPVKTDRNLIDLLSPHVNMDRDSTILFATWIAQSFCMGNHMCSLLMAEAGSGKSELSKKIRRVLDPSRLKNTTMPEKKDDLFAALTNSYFVAFDNLTDELSKDISDILCTAITGSTIAKRKLYTTNELGVYELHSTLVLNGIEILPSQADLASRCLLFNLLPISEENRKTDEELNSAFEHDLPEILGAIFNALSDAMKVIKTLKPKRLPRMSSAYVEMLAIAVAIGVPEAELERVFFANIAALEKARSNIAIVEAVQEYMNSSFVTGRSVTGTVKDLYEKICTNYSGTKKDLPKSASHFSRKLRQELKTFSAIGLNVLLDDTYADGTHVKFIKEK